MNLFAKKSLKTLLAEASEEGQSTLRRHLSAGNLVLLGIGAIIGAGLFVRTAAAAAEHAGPGVTISFIIGAIGCAFAGLCYAEFASMLPISGSAYTYSYATMGEFVAWIIGWDLVLEYALGAATVSIAWSEYLNKLLEQFVGPGAVIPYQWCHSPFQTSADGVQGIMNLPAIFILLMLTLILIRGIKESAVVNGVIVAVKVVIVLLFIALGWQFINPANHDPMVPAVSTYTNALGNTHSFGGWGGILAGAGVVFFAFIGFDAVSTAAQETKNPKRDMPVGIIGSLAICTVLYILFSYVLTGIAPYTDFRTEGSEASVTYAISKYMTGYGWLARFVTLAILFGFSSVILVMLLGQSRVFYSMSRDGLVPKIFSEIHPEYRTPWKSNWLFFVFVGLFAAFVPGSVVGDMTSIGTLFAFVLVSLGVIVMRRSDPDAYRPFKTPLVPIVPILGALVCGAMIFGLGIENWTRLFVWLIIGLVIYFSYSRYHSKVQSGA
ncbi:MAG TPA: amino acid permease [Saprospiraceae bacterium]|nr:amino acid permease [Saprospiraceae bacterium]HNM24189.1 amino acid permease [Saprospiraceae bacterium]